MLPFLCHAPDEDGIMLRPQLVDQHLGIRSGDHGRFPVVIQKTIGRLCPFQRDVRPLVLMEGEETAVEPSAFLFQNTYRDLYPCIPDFLYAPPLYFGERVNAVRPC